MPHPISGKMFSGGCYSEFHVNMLLSALFSTGLRCERIRYQTVRAGEQNVRG